MADLSNISASIPKMVSGFLGPDPIRKVKGKLVLVSGEAKIHNAQVFLYGLVAAEEKPQLVGTGVSDKDGNFSIAYPTGTFASAYLTIAVSKEQVEVVLKDGAFPIFTYAGFERVDMDALTDCSCKDSTPRLPDEEDFALSNTYSQDIGGSCTNFTTPNRALEEFSYYSIVRLTDPTVNMTPDAIRMRLSIIDAQIKQLQDLVGKNTAGTTMGVAPDTALTKKLLTPKDVNVEAQAMLNERDFNLNMLQQLLREREQMLKTGRKEISLMSPVNWEDDTINSNQATSVAFGHLLHWKQVWRADGYSLGDLVYSLPLAPGQKKNIAIMDWSRKEVASREEELAYEDRLSNSITRDRDINEIVNSVLTDAMSASSESKIQSKSWSIGASVSVPAGPVSVGVSGGYSSSNSSGSSEAEQNAARDLAAATMQNIRDKSMQSASSVRSQRSTVITTMEQSESMRVETETLANYNHCHAITIQYFEVLRHFALYTELADVQECIFVPLIMTQFDVPKSAKWKDTLSSYLKVNGRNQFNWYAKGLEACTRETSHPNLAAAYADLPAGAFCDDPVRSVWGSVKVQVNVTRPAEIYPPNMPSFEGIIAGAIDDLKAQLLINNLEDKVEWETQLGFIDNWENIRRKVYSVPPQKRDALFEQMTQTSAVAEQILSKLPLWLSKHNGNSPSQRFVPKYSLVGVTRASKAAKLRGGSTSDVYEFAFTQKINFTLVRRDVKSLIVSSLSMNGAQPLQMPGGSYFMLDEIKLQYNTDNYSGYLLSASGMRDDLNKVLGVSYDIPLSRPEMRNLRNEFQQAKNDLLRHLNENLEYYHKVLWHNMDADKRLMMLEAFQVEVPGRIIPGQTTPEPSEFRSIASVVENKIISIVGNSIVMPVARGYNLNPRFRFDNDTVEVDGKRVSKLHNYYMPDGYYKSAPYRISVPTQGVFGEAISGACNSCEKIDDSRFWKWEEHPIPDSPTAIQPISMDGRRADASGLTPSQFQNGLVSQSDPLATVDPTGMAQAMNLMGKSDVFRDITGLAANQANALAGLQATQAGAKAAMDNSIEMAKQAAEMYKFQQNMKNSDKFEDKVNNDKSLSPDEKKELLKKHYNKLLGDSGSDEAETKSNSPIGTLIDKIKGSNSGKITYKDPDGSSVDMEFVDDKVQGEVGGAPSESGENGVDTPDSQSIFDNTEEIDENDPDYVAARNQIEQLLDSMQPGIDAILSGINPNPPMA